MKSYHHKIYDITPGPHELLQGDQALQALHIRGWPVLVRLRCVRCVSGVGNQHLFHVAGETRSKGGRGKGGPRPREGQGQTSTAGFLLDRLSSTHVAALPIAAAEPSPQAVGATACGIASPGHPG